MHSTGHGDPFQPFFADVATPDAFGHSLFHHYHRGLLWEGGLFQQEWSCLQGGDQDPVQVRCPGGRREEAARSRAVSIRVRGEEGVAVGEARNQVN